MRSLCRAPFEDKKKLLEEAPQKSLFYVVVHFHGH